MTLPDQPVVPALSGERFRVRYLIRGSESAARDLAETIGNEQTVEFPDAALPAGDIRDHILGRLEQFEPLGEGRWAATISYAVEVAGRDLGQLLTVALGLSSLLEGITVDRLDLPEGLLGAFPGPRFGVAGLKERTGIHDRPLLCTALKPMGLTSENLADLAYRCAVSGLDMVKDDHGITDLPFSPFAERVERCAAAVARANAQTGLSCLYAANVTARPDVALERARFARQAGAGALLVSPFLTGFGLVQQLAADDGIGLPVLCHPSLSGGFLAGGSKTGFSHYLLFGQLMRLAGADVSIFANYGGRFPVSQEDSHQAVRGCRDAWGHIRPIYPMIGGGMQVGRIAALREEFGEDSIFLVGGGLHTASRDLGQNIRDLLAAVG